MMRKVYGMQQPRERPQYNTKISKQLFGALAMMRVLSFSLYGSTDDEKRLIRVWLFGAGRDSYI